MKNYKGGKRINNVKVFLDETQQTRYVTEETWARPRNGWRGQGKFVASSPLALIRNSPNDARFCRRGETPQSAFRGGGARNRGNTRNSRPRTSHQKLRRRSSSSIPPRDQVENPWQKTPRPRFPNFAVIFAVSTWPAQLGIFWKLNRGITGAVETLRGSTSSKNNEEERRSPSCPAVERPRNPWNEILEINLNAEDGSRNVPPFPLPAFLSAPRERMRRVGRRARFPSVA